MAVSLSPIGGVAAQFFDNNGNILAGGKLYSYEAGTTTPKTTYTSAAGTIANTNPIILTSAGRIPYEVWLTTGDSYKFVLTDSVGNSIGTWDNIYGYSSGSLDAQTEVQTATAGQTLFVLTTMAYSPGANTLGVYVDGVNQVVTNAYVETNATSVTFVSGLHDGATVKFINLNIGSTDASVVTYEQGGAGAVATTVQAKLRESVSVLDFGAVGDGVTDDTAAILAAFTHAGTFADGCEIDFPNSGDSIYLVGHGFVVPTGCRIKLNGCTIRATTEWNAAAPEPTFPGTFRSMFCIIGSLTGGATLTADVENISIIGDGAVIDMRYDEQTGTRRGSSGISVETTPAPIVANLWRVHDILVEDVTIKNCLWYSFTVTDGKNVIFQNCKSVAPWQLGFVVVSGWNISFVTCESSYARNGAGNQGVGYWNEANETWQLLRNIRYYNCVAEYNNRTGFKYYNDGKDVEVSVFAFGNISRFNQWNAGTSSQYSSPSDAGHDIYKSLTGLSDHLIKLVGCVAEEEYGAGFKVTRVAGGTSRQNFVLEDCVAYNCNKQDISGYSRSPFHVNVGCDSRVYISNPLVIAPAANVNGYGIGLESSKEVYITTPRFVGTFEYALVTGGTSGLARKTAGWDVAWDAYIGGHTGTGTPFYKPVRLASFDQTTQPVIGTDTYTNELAVWQDDANIFRGLYTRDDSNDPQYLDFRSVHGRLRAVKDLTGGSASVPAQSVETQTLTVTGAVLGDYVEVSFTVALDTALILNAQVTAADTVTIQFHNPSSGSVTRAAGYAVVNVISRD